MKENKLVSMSIDFSVDIINLLNNVKGHSSLCNQLERCATSIGANIHESNYAQSKSDFISKLEIALKESYEADYWLELLSRAKLASPDAVHSLKNQCGVIRRLLISSITTTKQNRDA